MSIKYISVGCMHRKFSNYKTLSGHKKNLTFKGIYLQVRGFVIDECQCFFIYLLVISHAKFLHVIKCMFTKSCLLLFQVSWCTNQSNYTDTRINGLWLYCLCMQTSILYIYQNLQIIYLFYKAQNNLIATIIIRNASLPLYINIFNSMF